jgi:hypothetical protein
MNPAVEEVAENPVDPAIPPLVDEYPVVVYPPDPICTNKETELASMLTSLNIMVMRFISDGSPVKEIDVPLVVGAIVEDLIKAYAASLAVSATLAVLAVVALPALVAKVALVADEAKVALVAAPALVAKPALVAAPALVAKVASVAVVAKVAVVASVAVVAKVASVARVARVAKVAVVANVDIVAEPAAMLDWLSHEGAAVPLDVRT